MKKIKLHLAATALVLGMLPASAMATTATGILNLSATFVEPSASVVVVGNLDFGTIVIGSDVGTVSNTFNVTVSSGVSYTVQLDGGLYAVTGQRNLRNDLGTQVVPYHLWKDPAGANSWNSGFPQSATGTGAAQSYDVHAAVAPGTPVGGAGSYMDIVTITVTY